MAIHVVGPSVLATARLFKLFQNLATARHPERFPTVTFCNPGPHYSHDRLQPVAFSIAILVVSPSSVATYSKAFQVISQVETARNMWLFPQLAHPH
jgi:hypothetical protein